MTEVDELVGQEKTDRRLPHGQLVLDCWRSRQLPLIAHAFASAFAGNLVKALHNNKDPVHTGQANKKLVQ